MADILSNLYLAYSIQWYGNHHYVPQYWTQYCINRLCNENKQSFNNVIDNYQIKLLKPLLFLQKYKITSEDFNLDKQVFQKGN